MDWTRPAKISVEFAFFKQSKVFPDLANGAHEETPETKFCQSISRRAALNSNAVAAEPDSKIFDVSWIYGLSVEASDGLQLL